jgi:hypothetical protein
MNRIAVPWLLAVAVVSLVASGCSKPPSPAQLALQRYADNAARRAPMPDDVVSGTKTNGLGTSGDELEEGVADYPPPLPFGGIAWTRFKLISEKDVEGGGKDIVLNADICASASDNGSCSRPNSYQYHALMRADGDDWRVAGARYTMLNQVR